MDIIVGRWKMGETLKEVKIQQAAIAFALEVVAIAETPEETETPTTTIPLAKGSNIITYNGTAELPAETAFAGITEYLIIYPSGKMPEGILWNPVDYKNEWQPGGSQIKAIKPGMMLALYVNTDCAWTY
jgi:hypothetical protein